MANFSSTLALPPAASLRGVAAGEGGRRGGFSLLPCGERGEEGAGEEGDMRGETCRDGSFSSGGTMLLGVRGASGDSPILGSCTVDSVGCFVIGGSVWGWG